MIADALVLTAGLGTRLRPLTRVRAKPAMPVGGDALVRRIVGWLAAAGATRLVLNLHHLPETVTAEVGDGADLGARVRYSWEQPVVLGSAGGPRQALDIVGADPFFLVNGDTLTDLDPATMAAEHARSGALVTLALVPNTAPRQYGGVRLDGDGRVTGFVPRGPAAEGSCHFIGVQVVAAEVFAGLAPGRPARSIGGVYDALVAARPGSIRGLLTEARFWDVGTVADYRATARAFGSGDGNQNRAPCPNPPVGPRHPIDSVGRCGGRQGLPARRLHRHRSGARGGGQPPCGRDPLRRGRRDLGRAARAVIAVNHARRTT